MSNYGEELTEAIKRLTEEVSLKRLSPNNASKIGKVQMLCSQRMPFSVARTAAMNSSSEKKKNFRKQITLETCPIIKLTPVEENKGEEEKTINQACLTVKAPIKGKWKETMQVPISTQNLSYYSPNLKKGNLKTQMNVPMKLKMLANQGSMRNLNAETTEQLNLRAPSPFKLSGNDMIKKKDMQIVLSPPVLSWVTAARRGLLKNHSKAKQIKEKISKSPLKFEKLGHKSHDGALKGSVMGRSPQGTNAHTQNSKVDRRTTNTHLVAKKGTTPLFLNPLKECKTLRNIFSPAKLEEKKVVYNNYPNTLKPKNTIDKEPPQDHQLLKLTKTVTAFNPSLDTMSGETASPHSNPKKKTTQKEKKHSSLVFI